MLRDEVKLFEELSGESSDNVSIERIGSFLDGYHVGKESTVKHAHWETTKLTSKWIFVCSHCRYGWYESYEGEDIAWKYCPDCGAKMDEEV